MTALRSVPLPDQGVSRSARRAERSGRLEAIEAMPEAEGKATLVKFGFALRFDLSLAQVRKLLSEAPATGNSDEIVEWILAVQAKPSLRLVR